MVKRSTLDPDNLPGHSGRKTFKGHDTRSLGPSDSSDTGSDLAGPGLIDDDVLGLDRGTNEDSEAGHLDTADAGASIGDLGLDDTSDRQGTGERLTAGKEPDVRIGGDIGPDRIVRPEAAGLGGGLDQAEEARAARTSLQVAEHSSSSIVHFARRHPVSILVALGSLACLFALFGRGSVSKRLER